MGLKKKVKTWAPAVGTGVGAIFGPAGAAIGGAAGGVLSSSLGDDKYRAPSFADIDLSRENPELYQQLQALESQVNEAQRLYDQRRQGPTELEMRQMSQSRMHLDDQMGARGLLGTSAGNSTSVDNEARLQQALQERIFQEQQSMLQNANQLRSGYANALLNAQQSVLNPMAQQSMTNFNVGREDDASRNQFYSGLVNAGLSMYGNQQNMDAMQQQRASYPGMYNQMQTSGYQQPMLYSGPTQQSYGYSLGVPSLKSQY